MMQEYIPAQVFTVAQVTFANMHAFTAALQVLVRVGAKKRPDLLLQQRLRAAAAALQRSARELGPALASRSQVPMTLKLAREALSM
jgi:hypothetical protein